MDIIKDYYKGYEGAPEIQFVKTRNNGDNIIIRLWVGQFDEIMNCLKPEIDGWTGLAYYYHLHEGWYDDSPWEIPDKIIVQKQISLSKKEQNSAETIEICNEILEMLSDTINTEEKVFIVYE